MASDDRLASTDLFLAALACSALEPYRMIVESS
jgi:hypothetical protein